MIKIVTTVELPWQRVADCIVGAFESSYSTWLGRVDDGADLTSKSLVSGFRAAKKTWYSEGDYWAQGGNCIAHYDGAEDDEGSFASRFTLDKGALEKGLKLLAEKCPHQFDNLVKENDDAITSDLLMQYTILGEEVYG